ncbi:TonB-dependent receptor [Alteromonadaceae bacterium Bs31]|nr:TonB-dependent receptor [Alteromonadaceae bacterium Bs31]
MFKRRMLSVMVALSASGVALAQTETAEESNETALPEEAFIEEVVVEGVRAADLNARALERDKAAFSSVIAQDDAGNFADQNVAESLQRLPGITLQKSEGEGQRINLRGLGPQFVNVTMNGSEMASASLGGDGEDSRGFGLDVVSADMLGGIEVNKTILPSMDTYSTAGSVNLKTVSAFDKGRNTLKLKAQVNSQAYREEANPKFAISGTNLFADETIGVGYSLSAEQRKTVNYENLHHDKLKPSYIDPEGDGVPMLVPYESQMRQENAQRTRFSGSLDLGWKPTDNAQYDLQFSHSEYEDEDIAIREYYRFYGGGTSYFTNPSNNTFGVTDAEVQQQFFIQESEVKTDMAAFQGENTFDGGWTLDYRLAYSTSTNDKPDGRRVQFRIRDLPMLGVFGEDFINGRPLTNEQLSALSGVPEGDFEDNIGAGLISYDANSVPTAYQEQFLYDNIFLEDTSLEDTITSFKINLQKDFEDGALSYIKFGLAAKDYERTRDRNRASLVPENYSNWCSPDGLPTTEEELECTSKATDTRHRADYVDTYVPGHPDMNFEHITQGSAEALLASTRALADNYDPTQSEQDSRKDDYVVTEESASAYIEAEFTISDSSSIITGLRYNTTDFSSEGNFTLRNDRFEDASTSPLSGDIVIPLEGTAKSYTDVHPSIHYRYEPSDEYVVRAALWTSGTRPGFDEARAYAQFVGRLNLCLTDETHPDFGTVDGCGDNPAGDWSLTEADLETSTVVAADNNIKLGNTALDPMFAVNFDASFGWYPNDDLFLQAAFFYKDIKDFIVEVRGKTSTEGNLPVDLPLDQIPYYNFDPNTAYEDVNLFDNGDSASVYGLELTYTQYFGSGLFVQSNATILDSEADMGADLRAETIRLPDMADTSVNFTLGWENDLASVRLIANHTSKILDKVGSCTQADIDSDAGGIPFNCESWNDIYYDAATNIDFKATYNVTDDVQVFFDAINLTQQVTNRYMEGNQYAGGPLMYRHEDFGTSVQLGVNWQVF